MRSLILSLLFVTSSIFAFGQASETCLTAEGAAATLATFPHTELITIDPLWTSDAEYIPPVSPSGPLSVGYWSFSVSASGFYNIDLQTTVSAMIVTDVSVGISDGTGSACPMDASLTEIYSGMLMAGLPVPTGCAFLAAGTYTMGFAVAQGDEGEIEVIINNATAASNATCATASPITGAPTPGMDNGGNNSCSSGLVWYEYTVVQGGSVTLTASTSGTGTDIPAADLILTQYSIDNCINFTPVLGNTVPIPCLQAGTVISFEVGDNMAPIEQGTFTVTIEDDPTTITNETCDDVLMTAMVIPTCITTALTVAGTNNTTMGACPDANSGCPTFEDESTVWFAFTTDNTAQTVDIEITNGSISGTEFALIAAGAGCPAMGSPATAIGGCQTGGSLMNQTVTPSTTYYIAVSTAAGGSDGTFTLNVTPQNPPANDICATDAIDISATAAGGVDGTTACATGDPLDFCTTITEDHVVYYTYTVASAINSTVTITTGGAGAGADATELGLGIFNDCLGAAATMPSGAALLPIAGTDLCDALNEVFVFECVEPGTSFTIAVASSDGLEGDFNIMITEMATGSATNDICDLGTNPDITAVTSGTNFCADGELSFCGMTTTADHQVWYQYTNNTGANVDLDITFTGTGGPSSALNLSMLVLSGACGTSTAFTGTPAGGYCDIIGMTTTIECIEDGETIRILVGSAEDPSMAGPEGDFNILATPISNSPVNDECTGAIDITPANTCEWITASTIPGISVTAENACPEDFAAFPAGCDFTTESTVWYSFTVPNDGETYTLDIQNIANDAFLSIFESTTGADCDTYGTPSINSDCESGTGPHGEFYDDLTNGATYFIAVGDPTAASGFDFEIRLNLLPSNDECANAVVLADNMATDGTTACATQEAPAYNGACADTDETNTVWYQYTVPPGNKGFHITIGAGATPFTAPIITSVFETDACDITAATLIGMDNCTASAAVDEQFECVGPGTYTIMVSTSSMNEGDFQITITPIISTVANDNCDAPDMSLDPGLECEWMPTTATTIDACPEDMNLDPTDCGIDEFPVVWYSITAPANATFLDLQITAAGSGTPFMAVYDQGVDCDNLTFVAGSTCYTGIFDNLNALGQTQITVTPGTIYLVAIGTNDLAGSTIDFEIKWITPPDNDECSAVTGTGAEMLIGNTPTDGTTACATQPTGGEYNSPECTDADETNSVFYTYEVPATDKGFNITITGATVNGLTGDINLVVFEDDPVGSCATGSGAESIDDVCTVSGAVVEEFECVGSGTYVIRVSTSALNEGDFQITIEPLTLEQPNDNCDAPDMSLNPGLECEWMDIMATTTGACPEDMNLESGGCMLDMFPVTWYEVTAPANAEFLDLRIISGGTNPFLSVFEPGSDCDNLTNVAGSACFQGTFTDLVADGNALIDVVPGNTYLIAVGSQNAAGTIVNFGIKWITPPDNDECADAVDFNALTPSGNPGEFSQTLIMETTQCATVALTGTACDPDKTNTVWYTYTVGMDVKEITIDITNYMNTNTDPTAMAEFSLAVFDGCTSLGFLNQADGSVADYCGGEGDDLLRFSCLDEGDVLTILVSSSSINEGTFDITLNTSVPDCMYTNDLCNDASPLTGNPNPLITDDPNDCVLVLGCNDLACSEFDFSGVCPGIDVLNSVFYTFTTDGLLDVDGNPVDAFVNIEILNGQSGELDSPGAILLSGPCTGAAVIGACAGTGGVGTFNSGPLGMPGEILPSTTYTVVVYNGDTDQNGGTFELCVTVSSGCVNDGICDAFTLDPGVTVDNPASSVGCTADFDVSGCGAAQNEATLWYQVDVPEGASSITVTLANQSVDGVTGDVSIAVGPLGDCNNFDDNDVLYTDPNCAGFTTNGGVHEIECAVEFGTYWIQIGSEDDMEAGDFTITYDFNLDPEPLNDLCSSAENLVVTDLCEFVPFRGTLLDACPELFDLGACQYSMNGAVWYTITIPAGPPTILDMDIEIELLANPMIGVFEFDCMNAGDPINGNGIINSTMNPDGTVDCSEMPLTEGIVVTPGNTYHILVSSSSMEDTDFNINIKLNAPPINDDPCNMSINPPFDLTMVGSHPGTTCCARGPRDENPDGSAADLESVDCSAATEGSAVWYQFTPDENDEGYLLDFAGSTGGNVTVEVYWGQPAAGCNGGFAETIASSCTDQNVMFNIPNCPEPGDVMFVKVTTTEDECGDFNISITPALCDITTATDDCIDAIDIVGVSVTDINCEAFDEVPFQGCLDYACPETVVGDCMFSDNPTVWIQVEVDDLASQLVVDITANGDWDPVWAIYTGPCDALTLVQGGTGGALTNCSNDDDSPAHQVPVESDLDGTPLTNTYYIAISAQGYEPGEDGSFSGTVLTTAGCVSCIGGNDDFSLACNNTSTWEVTDRSSDRDLDDPQFCVGETVSMCATLDYDASATSVDWLHGVIPNFGPGWNINDFDGTTATLSSTNGGNPGNWFESGGDCAPFITETLPLLCTYFDDEGVLQICNDFCGTCPGNCVTPLQSGSPLPSGWFWNGGPGGEAGCGGDCTPSDNYGIGAITTTVEICFTITVKDFDSFDDCVENNDLKISLVTTSDGVSGCYEDPIAECTLDAPQFSPDWTVDCNTPPRVLADDIELCDNGTTSIFVQTEDGSITTIIIEPIPNGGVTGANMYEFTNGSGTIEDMLDNITTQTQVQQYITFTVDPTKPCPGPIDTINVTIYSEVLVELLDDFVCEGNCTTLSPVVSGGFGAPYTYLWSNGETTPTIEVCPIVATTYGVTVTDGFLCEGADEAEVTVVPPVVISFEEDPIDACKDGNFDPFQPEYVATLIFESGSAPYSINWIPELGLIGQPTSINGFNDSWIINEEATDAFLSPYQLCAEVTDNFGCMGDTCMTINITGEVSLIPEVLNLVCGVDDAQIRITGLEANTGNPVIDFNLFGGCPAEDLLETGFSNSGVVTFDINSTYLNNYSQFTVQGVTTSGCVASICVDIDVPQGTPIDISGDENICESGSATITIDNAAAAGYTVYTWTPDVGSTESVTVSPTITTTYFVETMDGAGCVSDTSFTVNVNPEPIISLSGTTTFCSGGTGGTATITATGGDTYNWTGTNGTASGDSYTADMQGSVDLEVVSGFGCISDTTIVFTEESIITVNIGGPSLCDEMPDTLFVVGSFTSYEWTFNSTVVGNDSILIISEAGTYDINVVDVTLCPGVGTIEISNFSTPLAMVTDTLVVCNEDSGVGPVTVDFDAQITGDLGTWVALTNVVSFDPNNASSVDFTGAAPGCYGYVYSTMNATLPCMNTSDTLYVCVEPCPCPLPTTSAILDLCNDDTYNLTNAQVTLELGSWSVISGPASQDLAGLIVDNEFIANGILAGTYTVEFTLTAPGNNPPCLVSSTQTIEVFEALEVTALEGTMCNITGQAFPTILDLYSLISFDDSDGGTWSQVGTPVIPITGGSMIDASDLTDFPVDLIFSYTSSDPVGPCGPITVSVDVEIRDCACSYVNVLPDTLCNDGGLIDLSDLLENPDGLTGEWSVTPGSISGTNMFDSNVSSGAYVITYTLTESAGPGCDEMYSNTIIVRKKPEIEFVAGPMPCSEDTGNGPTSIDLYDWLDLNNSSNGTWTQTGGSPITFTDDGITAIVDFDPFNTLDQFEFTYTTNVADLPCTDISAFITIVVADCNCPPIGLIDPEPICNDQGTLDICGLIGASDPGTFMVLDPAGNNQAANIDVTGCIFDAMLLAPGTYTIIYTLDQQVTGSCDQTDTVFVDLIEYESVMVSDPDQVCSDAEGMIPTEVNFDALLSIQGGGIWSNDDGVLATGDLLATPAILDFEGVANGNYNFTYTIDNVEPCEDFVQTITVNVTALCNCTPIMPDDPADVCNTDGPVDLTQYDDPAMPGTWSSTELTIENGNSLITDGVLAGAYTLTYTLTTLIPDCPETAEVMILIGEPANPGVPAEDLRICESDVQMVVLDDRLTDADFGGVWTETSTSMSTGFSGNTFDSDGQSPGTYTFQYSITENAPCPDADVTVTIIIDPNPVADAGMADVLDCVNTSEDLGGAGTSTGDDFVYSWTLAGDEVGTEVTLAGVTVEGTYQLLVTNSATGCADSSTVTVVKSDDLPTFMIATTDITCNGDNDGALIISDQNGGDGNYEYSLNGGAAVEDAGSFTGLIAGDYTIAIIDGIGCTTEQSFTILEPDPVTVNIAGEEILVGDLGAEFTLTIDPAAENIDSVVWSDFNNPAIIFCSGTLEECTSITLSPDMNTTVVYVEAFDANGCSANDQVQIQLSQIVDVIFPNIITPNGDGTNDFFFIASDDVEQVLDMKIFDRWGELIWEKQLFDPRVPSEGWNGKFNDSPVVPGVYVFTVDVLFNDLNSTRESFSGDVTVTDGE